MKKKFLLLTLAAGSVFSMHANASVVLKADSAAKTVHYASTYIKLPVSDFRKLVNTAVDYKTQVIYNPFLSGDEKTALQISYDRYIYNLNRSIKIDSVLTLPTEDYQKLLNTATDYKTLLIYNPFLSGDEKTALQINFDRYIYTLKKAVKTDGVAATK